MNRDTYLKRENWYGGWYELAMEFVPGGDDSRLLAAIAALWSAPELRGPWQNRERYGDSATLPTVLETDSNDALYGTMRLATGQEIGCLSTEIREEDGSDWLDLCLPTGMLNLAYPVGYPITRRANHWLDRIDEQFLEIAERIYAAAPFDFATFGEEASALLGMKELTVDHLNRGGLLFPPQLFQALGANGVAIRRPSGLYWFPWRIE